MSEFQLFADEFTEADQLELVGFSCGETTQGRACTQWIRGADVHDSIKRGTRVWLFRDLQGQVVGFGSVGPIRWRWPLPDGTYTNLLYIPMFGMDHRFQGQPPDKAWRFSHQMMNHLMAMAGEMNSTLKTASEWLLLMVAPDNEPAIRLYTYFGFDLISNVTRGPGLLVMKRRLKVP